MENLNTDQVLIWVLIIIALGAVAWAALQNWFFNQRNRYNQFPPYFPPYGAYPPNGGYGLQNGSDYPHLQTPRSSSPFLTLVLVVIAGIVVFKWVSGIKPDIANDSKIEQEEEFRPDSFQTENSDVMPWLDEKPQQEETPVTKSDREKIIEAYDGPAMPRTNPEIQVPESVPSESVPSESVPSASAPSASVTIPQTGFSIQVAALEDEEGFERLVIKLRKLFPRATIFRYNSELGESGVDGDKLLIGRFDSREAALKGAKKLKALGYEDCFPVAFEEMNRVEVVDP